MPELYKSSAAACGFSAPFLAAFGKSFQRNPFQPSLFQLRPLLRNAPGYRVPPFSKNRCALLYAFMLLIALHFAAPGNALQAPSAIQFGRSAWPPLHLNDPVKSDREPALNPIAADSVGPSPASTILPTPSGKLIVVGFLGGRVRATNFVHREALLIQSLQDNYSGSVHALAFANRDGSAALRSVLELLSKDREGGPSSEEKQAAKIVIFGHSWGASEAVTLAGRLNHLGIPVLLTIQVDSVRKRGQNDERIPPNVKEAINFYQSEGMLRGRSRIVAADPAKTTILDNRQSSYSENPVSCAGFPWYARAFMRRHIQIENDPAVWNAVEALILAQAL